MSAEPEGFAVRFLPADPARRDEPAAYLSTYDGWPRLTSVPDDICSSSDRSTAEAKGRDFKGLLPRADRDKLVADVVPLADALTDLAS